MLKFTNASAALPLVPIELVTFSSHLLTAVDELLHSISELPVTPVIKEELERNESAKEDNMTTPDPKSKSQEEGVEREIFTMPSPPPGLCGREGYRQAGGQHRDFWQFLRSI